MPCRHLFRVACLLVAVNVVWLLSGPDGIAADESWIGQQVIARSATPELYSAPDEQGNRKVVGRLEALDPRVQKEEPGWLLVRDWNGREGWIKKSEVVVLARATAYFTDVLAGNAKDAHAYHARGVARTNLGQLDEAIKDLNEAIRLNPTGACYNSRGNAWYMRKDYDKALQDHNEAIRLIPKHAVAYNNRGLDWRAKGDHERAIQDHDQAIKLEPRFADAYNDRAGAWFSRKDYDKAFQDYNEAIRLDPGHALAYCNRGLVWSARGQPDRAIEDCNVALRLAPGNAIAYYHRGLAWIAKDEHAKAIADLDEAIRIEPKNAVSYHSRGNVWRARQEYDKAIADYTQAIQLSPRRGLSYIARGTARLLKKDFEKAAADYNEAVQLDAKDPWAYNARAWLLATCPDARYRHGDKAIEAARRASELADWKEPHCISTLAAAYAESGQFDQAVYWQNKALELVPGKIDDKKQVEKMRDRLKLFEQKKPYRQEFETATNPK